MNTHALKPLYAVVAALLPIALPAQEKPAAQPSEAHLQARNAARMEKGGRVSLELLARDVVKDSRTSPAEVADGNVHSRQVITGAPYRLRIDLVDELPLEAIHLMCSDYGSEASPKDLEIRLSDGTTLRKTMERLIPQKGKPRPRQTVDTGGRRARWIEVTVLSNHAGSAKWGGMGEIEVISGVDLAPYLTLTDFNPDLPQDIRSAPPRQDYSGIKVTLPPPIPLGQRPGVYLSTDEWTKLFLEMRGTERGKATLDGILGMANGYFDQPVVHPDPSVPAQLKHRGDAAAKAHDALARQAGIMGYAWRMTQSTKYAARAREILLGYARLYPDGYQEHKGVNGSDTSKVMAQRLSEAMWIIPLIQAYDLSSDADVYTEADRKRIEEDLIRHALTFINRKQPAAKSVAERNAANPSWRTDPAHRGKGGAIGNWTALYNTAFIQGGSVLGDADWIDLGAAGMKHMLENGIGEDGMWGEGAIGYQQFARHAMVGGLEALARKNIDLWNYKNNVFKNLFDSEFAYAYPDGTSPGINDSGRAPVGSGWTAMAFDYAYLRYGDANYAHTINRTTRQLHHSSACYFPTLLYAPLAELPVKGQGSLVFDKLGYAILRGTDGGGETFVLMDYGPHGGVHGHPDKLNLILFADGDELAGEPQGYRYEDPRHSDWTRPTVAHWTLSIDTHSQSPTTGRLLCFADAGDIKVIRSQAAGAYAGVALDRAVIQLPGCIVDIHRAWGPASHTVDYPLCFRGALDRLDGVATNSLKPLAATPGYRHLLATALQPAEGPWTGVWSRDASRVSATVLPAPGTLACAGYVPGERQQALLRRTGTDVRFVAVIDPYRSSDAVTSARQFDVEGTVPATGVEIMRTDGGTDTVIVRYDAMPDGAAKGPLVTVVRRDAEGRRISGLDLGGTARR